MVPSSVTTMAAVPSVLSRRNTRLKAASTIRLPEGACSVHVATGEFPLTLVAAGGNRRYAGLITGKGSLRIEAAADHGPLEFSGTHTNSYQGATTLARGVLKLNRTGNAIAIPGSLTLGGSAAENRGDGVIWGADGQCAIRPYTGPAVPPPWCSGQHAGLSRP